MAEQTPKLFPHCTITNFPIQTDIITVVPYYSMKDPSEKYRFCASLSNKISKFRALPMFMNGHLQQHLTNYLLLSTSE